MNVSQQITQLNSLGNIGTKQCEQWRKNIISRHHPVANLLIRHYKSIDKKSDYVAANRWLGTVDKELALGRTGLKIHSTEQQLRDYCKAKATNIEREIHQTAKNIGNSYREATFRERVNMTGANFPLKKQHNQKQLIAALARICNQNWWFKQLRRLQWRKLENFQRRYGSVHKKAQIYVSDITVNRRKEQKRTNKQLMERLEAENDHGQKYTLAELSELSPSNPIVRRAELMVRMRGFEELSQHAEEGYTSLFFTLTCPSKYHASLSSGHINPKYNQSTVSDAMDYLNRVWQRVRANYDYNEITPFGMRVVEPHHDGTPHWHLLLFVPNDQVELATHIFEKYALQEDGDERGAKENRLKTVIIDPERGSATGYIAKYIAKNIDGENVGEDHYGRDAIQSAIRIEAWASVHGIRQFQQIGGASITVWRELRRLDQGDVDQQLVKQLIKAADESDWATYNELMGGAICKRAERPVRPMMIEREEENQYGEIVSKIKGLIHGTSKIITRPYEWVVSLLKEARSTEEAALKPAINTTESPNACSLVSFSSGTSDDEIEPPWSSVNNCRISPNIGASSIDSQMGTKQTLNR